ncbi:MAG: molybdopterin dinucleotide-binding protein [Methanomicrobiales archaeon]|nr:molybdopterin dinucleotide-binding protein [Methanomicrobiales archaeon]
MKFLLFTGRTILQGNAVESKLSPEYRNATSVCFMTPFDMMEAGIDEGDAVLVKGPGGQVVLIVRGDEHLPAGHIFLPYGPYANHVIPPGTHGTGMPDYKSVSVEVEPADGEPVSVWDLMKDLGGVPYPP